MRILSIVSLVSAIVVGFVVLGVWAWAHSPWAIAGDQAQTIAKVRSMGGNVDPLLSGDRLPEVVGVFRFCDVSLKEARFTDEDLAVLDGLHASMTLILSDTNVSDRGIRVLSQLNQSKVHEIDLSGTKISDEALEHLEKMPGLSRIDLSRTSVTDNQLWRLKAMKDMRHIRVADTGITDEGVKSLIHVLRSSGHGKDLDLSGTVISDACLEDLKGLGFDNLKLSHTKVTDKGIMHLLGSRIESLSVSNTKVTDSGIEMLYQLKGLGTLDLGSTAISGTGIAELSRLKMLFRLTLDNTPVGNDEMKALSTISGLSSLSVAHTDVTDAGLHYLKRLGRLRYLDVSGTRVTRGAVERLKVSMPGLTEVVGP